MRKGQTQFVLYNLRIIIIIIKADRFFDFPKYFFEYRQYCAAHLGLLTTFYISYRLDLYYDDWKIEKVIQSKKKKNKIVSGIFVWITHRLVKEEAHSIAEKWVCSMVTANENYIWIACSLYIFDPVWTPLAFCISWSPK